MDDQRPEDAPHDPWGSPPAESFGAPSVARGPSLPPPPGDAPPFGGAIPPPGGAYGYGGYGAGYGYGTPVQPTLDKGARTSLVSAIVGIFICGILLGPAAIYEGVKSRKRIRESNGALTGDGLALAGIIIGSIVIVLSILGIIFVVWAAGRPPTVRRVR